MGRIIGLQFVVTLVTALLLLILQNKASALSAFLGGSIGYASASAYALRTGIMRGITPRELLRAQYSGEALKFLVTVLLFAGIFLLFKKIVAVWLFLTYIATQLVYWAALLFQK